MKLYAIVVDLGSGTGVYRSIVVTEPVVKYKLEIYTIKQKALEKLQDLIIEKPRFRVKQIQHDEWSPAYQMQQYQSNCKEYVKWFDIGILEFEIE